MYARRAGDISGQQGDFIKSEFGYQARTHLPAFDGAFTRNVLPSGMIYDRNSTDTHRDDAGTMVTVADDVAPFDHDKDGNPRGLQVQDSRNFIVMRSEELNGWSADGATAEANAANGPDGVQAMELVREQSGTGYHMRVRFPELEANRIYTMAAFFRVGSGTDYAFLRVNEQGAFGNRIIVRFNIATGAVVNTSVVGNFSSIGSGVIDYGGGLYRCWMAFETGALSVDLNCVHGVGVARSGSDSHAGSTAVFIYAGYVTMERGEYPTSYRLTTTSATPREAASATIPIALSSQEVSLVAKGRTAFGTDSAGLGEQTIWQWDDGSTANLMRCYRNSFGGVRIQVISGSAEQTDSDLGTVGDDTDMTVACRVAANDFAGKLNGETLRTDDTIIMPTALTTFRVGHGISGDFWDNTVEFVRLYQSHFPNSQVTALSP